MEKDENIFRQMNYAALKGFPAFKNVDIEYFAQVSFSTFVEMIDSLGGVVVDVPLDMCMDQDSYRNVKQPYCLVTHRTI